MALAKIASAAFTLIAGERGELAEWDFPTQDAYLLKARKRLNDEVTKALLAPDEPDGPEWRNRLDSRRRRPEFTDPQQVAVVLDVESSLIDHEIARESRLVARAKLAMLTPVERSFVEREKAARDARVVAKHPGMSKGAIYTRRHRIRKKLGDRM